jgi:hypothetical protein
VVGRSAKAVANIMSRGQHAGRSGQGGADPADGGLRRRIKAGSSVVIGLQTIALVLMAVGHYI